MQVCSVTVLFVFFLSGVVIWFTSASQIVSLDILTSSFMRTCKSQVLRNMTVAEMTPFHFLLLKLWNETQNNTSTPYRINTLLHIRLSLIQVSKKALK